MAGNILGTLFRLTTFGESHGPCVGCVVEGCPPGIPVDPAVIQLDLDRRRPGQSALVTPRQEVDRVQLLSGVFLGKSTGAPIALLIPNTDQRPEDYHHLKNAYRPGHADFTVQAKYGIRDYRGGGRSSARETAARVAGGSIAKFLLQEVGISVRAFVSQVGPICLTTPYDKLTLHQAEENAVRCPDPEVAMQMERLIAEVKATGDTLGGVITGIIQGCPPGLGEPVFDRLHADLGKAMLSINAAKGFEIGSGFAGVLLRGSEHNDLFETYQGGLMSTKTNHSGGILGGISNGMDIPFRVAFKPVSTLLQSQPSMNEDGEPVVLEGKGRHDACVVPRAVPIVEAMAALVMADHWLRQKANL